MEIIKVIVRGELPRSCLGCPRRHIRTFVDGDKCNLTWRIIDDIPTRPPWCPLALKKGVCEICKSENNHYHPGTYVCNDCGYGWIESEE